MARGESPGSTARKPQPAVQTTLGASGFLEDEIRVGVPVSREEPFQLAVLRRHAGEDSDVITNSAHSCDDIFLGFQGDIADLGEVQGSRPDIRGKGSKSEALEHASQGRKPGFVRRAYFPGYFR